MESKIHLPLPLHVKEISNLYNLSLFISIIFDFGTLFISKMTIYLSYSLPLHWNLLVILIRETHPCFYP